MLGRIKVVAEENNHPQLWAVYSYYRCEAMLVKRLLRGDRFV